MPLEALTIADRPNAARIGERFARKMFEEPSAYIRDGKMSGVTEEMLAQLLTEVYRIGFESGVAQTKDMLGTALQVIQSFRPLAQAAKAIVEDGWPGKLATAAELPASLEARLVTLKAAYEGIADMVANADAEAGTPAQ